MILCCDSISSLGCFNGCAVINTGFVVVFGGTFVFVVEFDGQQLEITKNFLTGQLLQLDNHFNENYTHVMKVTGPHGFSQCYSFTNSVTKKIVA